KATMLTWVSACAAPISPRLPTRPARKCVLRVLNKMSLHLAFFVEPIVRAAPRRASDSAGLPDRNEAPAVALERRQRRSNAADGVEMSAIGALQVSTIMAATPWSQAEHAAANGPAVRVRRGRATAIRRGARRSIRAAPGP